MPFPRPSLDELVTRCEADIKARLPGAVITRRSVLGVLARVWAAGLHGVYGFLAWLFRQLFIDSADADMLARHAGTYAIARRGAVAAAGQVTMTGTDGAVIPAGTVLQRPDGSKFTTTAEAIIAGGTATVPIAATAPGTAANVGAGGGFSMVSPVAGVQSAATTPLGVSGGADAEADESLRARTLDRRRKPPHGGNKNDHETWAKAQDQHGIAVSHAWVRPLQAGDGTVVIYILMAGTYADGIPTAQDAATVEAYIARPEIGPVVGRVFVAAPTRRDIDLVIHVSPLTPSVMTAIEAEIDDYFAREGEPGSTVWLSRLSEAISRAAGESHHRLMAPAGDVAMVPGEIPRRGAITWGAY